MSYDLSRRLAAEGARGPQDGERVEEIVDVVRSNDVQRVVVAFSNDSVAIVECGDLVAGRAGVAYFTDAAPTSARSSAKEGVAGTEADDVHLRPQRDVVR